MISIWLHCPRSLVRRWSLVVLLVLYWLAFIPIRRISLAVTLTAHLTRMIPMEEHGRLER